MSDAEAAGAPESDADFLRSIANLAPLGPLSRSEANRVRAIAATLTSPSDAPPPALGELARTLDVESLGNIARRLVEAREAVPFDSFRYVTAKRAYESAFGAYADGPTNVLQLVALAAGGAETALREAMTAAADELENDPKTRTCYNVAAALRDALTPERPADADQ